MRTRLRFIALIAVPLAGLAAPAVAAEVGQSDLLRSLGEFVLNGLGPARTMEDIQREEREAAARARAAAREAAREAEAAPPTMPAADAAPLVSPPQPAAAEPAAAVVRMAKVEPAKVAAPEPAKVAVIPPPPRPRPQAEATRAAPVAVTLPPPEPLKSHIAATATVDQAIKLGGASGLYGRRLAVD